MRLFKICLFFLLVGLSAHAADDSFEFQASESECYPGDVIHLQATMRSSKPSACMLSIPDMDELFVVGIEKHPVRLEEGTYVQTVQWIVQPTRAGTLAIEGAEMVIGSGPLQERVPLPPASLTVHSYDSEEDSLKAEGLPTESVAKSGYTIYWILVIAMALAAATGFGYWRFKPQKEKGDDSNELPTLADLLKQVSGDRADKALLESILIDPNQQLPDSLRQSMEQCAYGERPNWGALQEALIKEVGQ